RGEPIPVRVVVTRPAPALAYRSSATRHARATAVFNQIEPSFPRKRESRATDMPPALDPSPDLIRGSRGGDGKCFDSPGSRARLAPRGRCIFSAENSKKQRSG